MRAPHLYVLATLLLLAVVAGCNDQPSPSAPERSGQVVVDAEIDTSLQPQTLAAVNCGPYQGFRIGTPRVLRDGRVRYTVWLLWRDGKTLHRARAIGVTSQSPAQLQVLAPIGATSFDVRWISGTRATVELTDDRRRPCLRGSVTLRR